MIERLARGESPGGVSDGGRPRRRAARVEGASIVMAVALGEQEAPVDIAEQRPQGDRPQVHPFRAQPARRVPGFREPAQLLVAMTAVMDLGDGQRDSVTLPRFPKPRRQAGVGLEPLHPHRLGVDIGVAAVPARLEPGIEVDPVIEEALAGQIMVDADHVGPRLARREPVDLRLADAGLEQALAPVMRAVDPPGEEVEAQPPPLILVRGLAAERSGREDLAEILGLDEAGAGHGGADRPHRLEGAKTLVDQGAKEGRIVAAVRIPMAVEA
jgi:hypothetical protein